jgi:hypothetical protein
VVPDGAPALTAIAMPDGGDPPSSRGHFIHLALSDSHELVIDRLYADAYFSLKVSLTKP